MDWICDDMSKWYLLIAMIFFCNMSLDPHGMNRGTTFVFEQKKWGDIPRYAHILLYFWPETYTQKEEIRKHDLIRYIFCLFVPQNSLFVTKAAKNFSYTFSSHYDITISVTN